jgi:hypothetical protein
MRKAWIVLASASASVVVGGAIITLIWKVAFWAALYCSVGLASTEGCAQSASTGVEQVVTVAIMLISIPLLAAAFSLLTSAHIHKHLSLHIDKRLAEHHENIRQMIRENNEQKS